MTEETQGRLNAAPERRRDLQPLDVEEDDMARYGQKFKDQAVSRMMPPESCPVDQLSAELGVSVATLKRWHSAAHTSPEEQRGDPKQHQDNRRLTQKHTGRARRAFIVRKIPDDVFRELRKKADMNYRSTEAEARQALQAWVAPHLIQESRNTRRKALANRLNMMLTQFNAGRDGSDLKPSHIAELIGEERAEHVEDWFLGIQEPDYSHLTKIANLLGVDPAWLKHGDEVELLSPCSIGLD